jgi:hypothetical protein
VHKKTLLLLLAFAIVFDFSGCAMSPQARRDRAYRHYVAKQTKKRHREMARAQKAANREMKLKMKNLQPSEPKITTTLEDFSPESTSAPIAPSEPAPAFKEPVVDPITVSASSTIPTDTAPQQ